MKTVASYFVDRFRNQDHIDDAHIAQFQRDFAATVDALDRAHAFTNARILWNYWKNPKNQSQILNAASIRAKYGELPMDALVGLVWSMAVEARAARIRDAQQRKGFILRSYYTFINNSTVRAVYTNSAVVFGWDCVRWVGDTLGALGTASLVGALYAISGGITNNALNPVLRPMMDWLARWAPNNFLIRFLARHSQRIFTPNESVKAEAATKDAKNSLSRLADQLGKVDFTSVPLDQAKDYWKELTHQFSEANLHYISGLPGYLKDGRNFRNDALIMRPLAFSQAITVQLNNYELNRAGLWRLRKALHQEYGIPLGKINAAIAEPDASRAARGLKEAGRSALRERASAGDSSAEGLKGEADPAGPDDDRVSMMEAEVDQLFEHSKAMKNAAKRAGATLASWLDHNNGFKEYFWGNAPKLAETADQMADTLGMDFFRQLDVLRPHFTRAFANLRGEMDEVLNDHNPDRKKQRNGAESEESANPGSADGTSPLVECLEADLK